MVLSGTIKVRFKRRIRAMHFSLCSHDAWFIYQFLEELRPYTNVACACPPAVDAPLMNLWREQFGVVFTEVIEYE